MKKFLIIFFSTIFLFSCGNISESEKNLISLFESHLNHLKEYNSAYTGLIKSGKLDDTAKQRISSAHKKYTVTGLELDKIFKKKIKVSDETHIRIEKIKHETREALKIHLAYSAQAFKISGVSDFFEKLVLDTHER